MEPNGKSPSGNKSELELKKLRLAELRANKLRQDAERASRVFANNDSRANGRPSCTTEEVADLMKSVGLEPAATQTARERTPEKVNGFSRSRNTSPNPHSILTTSRLQTFEITPVQTVAVTMKEAASYCKTTQTDDERVSVGEFSMGSQEFDYDDDMMHMDSGFRGRAHSHDLESPMTDDFAAILPGFNFSSKHKDGIEEVKKEEEPTLVRELTEEEKAQIMNSRDFQIFFNYASKVVERALAEEDSIFSNYQTITEGEVVSSSDRLVKNGIFDENKWAANRCVTGIAFSDQHPELMAVCYDQNPLAPMEPSGVVLVWNTKFKTAYPEFVFHCQSRLSSVTFARFHPHLVVAGCYSGQLCIWDIRVANKKTPINKSPLSAAAHTHPVTALNVIGSRNAHNLVSLSSDGRICSWDVDNLTQPVDAKDVVNKAGKQMPVFCMSFPVGDMNNFVAGAEDGRTYSISRHGGQAAAAMETMEFSGHSAPVVGIVFHRATGNVDFGHLFLTASCDWTVKLWSTKDVQFRFSFEAHTDHVLDVAWSPVHPAVFVSVDSGGNLFLWNLNVDIEGPATRMRVSEDEKVLLRKVQWSENGQHLFVGDDVGNVHMFDVHEALYTLRSEEWIRFSRVLADMKQASEEADELVISRLSTTSTTNVINAASLPGLKVSPR